MHPQTECELGNLLSGAFAHLASSTIRARDGGNKAAIPQLALLPKARAFPQSPRHLVPKHPHTTLLLRNCSRPPAPPMRRTPPPNGDRGAMAFLADDSYRAYRAHSPATEIV